MNIQCSDSRASLGVEQIWLFSAQKRRPNAGQSANERKKEKADVEEPTKDNGHSIKTITLGVHSPY